MEKRCIEVVLSSNMLHPGGLLIDLIFLFNIFLSSLLNLHASAARLYCLGSWFSTKSMSSPIPFLLSHAQPLSQPCTPTTIFCDVCCAHVNNIPAWCCWCCVNQRGSVVFHCLCERAGEACLFQHKVVSPAKLTPSKSHTLKGLGHGRITTPSLFTISLPNDITQ